jgi:murein L,D-transpeptidase YafK
MNRIVAVASRCGSARRLVARAVALLVLVAALATASGVPTAAADETAYSPFWPTSQTADRIVVHKMDRELDVLRQGQVLYRFRISLGRRPYGAKLYEGDGRTPEGTYFIDGRNPDSRFYKSLHISYPNANDIAAASFHGVSAGGAIVIHGVPPELEDLGPRQADLDWTEGCIAVTNEQMDILWSTVPDGTVIQILP